MTDSLCFKKFYGSDLPDVIKMSWKDLHELRGDLKRKSEKIIADAERDNRPLKADEDKGFNLALKVIDEINAEFALRNEHGTRDPLTKPVRTVYENGSSEPESRLLKANEIGLRYKDLYGDKRNKGPFNSLEDFLMAVAEKRSMLEKVLSQGGATVPEFWASQIYDSGIEASVAASRCRMFPLNGPTLHIPAWDMETQDSALYGGFAASWSGENVSNSETEPQFRVITLNRNKLLIYTSASREVLMDGIGLEATIPQALAKTIGFYLDEAIIATGDGINKPQSVLNANAAISVARNTGGDIKYADIVGMYARQLDLNGAVWLANPKTLTKLLVMADTANGYIWIPDGNAAGKPVLSLLGLPVVLTSKCKTLGTRGDLVLANFGYYALGVGSEIIFESQNATYWSTDKIAMRSIMFVTGASLLDTVVTPRNGDTLSPFVVLE